MLCALLALYLGFNAATILTRLVKSTRQLSANHSIAVWNSLYPAIRVNFSFDTNIPDINTPKHVSL